MISIVKYSCEALAGAKISCIMIKGEPWFKGVEIAKILGHENERSAIYKHVPLKFKHKLNFLLSNVCVSPTDTLTMSDLDSYWISEAGLYKLVFKSKVKFADIFTDWVCSEVLPQIRKTGNYNNNYHYNRNKYDLGVTAQQRWIEVQKLAEGREDELHYKVVKHIKHRYPDTTIHAGIGEHLTTDHARMDAYLKGYTAGQPDITILCGLPNGFQDVLAIELKNPNCEGILSNCQINYHKNLKQHCNIETIVGHNYDEIIIAIHEHYKKVLARAQTPAITDKPKKYNFATNDNPQYWYNKLRGKGLREQWDQRELPKKQFLLNTNRSVATILITFDKTHN